VGNNNFALGYVTLIDFLLAELADLLEALYPYRKYENTYLLRIRHHFNNLPGVKAYY